jgi:hypothetical protein
MTSRRRTGLSLLAALGALGLLAACTPPPPPPAPSPVFDAACSGALVTSVPGSIASPDVRELSGLAAGGRTDGVWWAHNDSGDSARVFAVASDGRDLGQFTLAGASATDWEDVAVGPGPVAGTSYLYVADIGDNAKARPSVRLYRVAEPAVSTSPTPPPSPQTLSGVDALELVYPDGPHDAEALFVDPVSGNLFVVTKELGGTAQVFRALANLPAGSRTTLTQVATVALGFGRPVTAADVTATGDVVALRTYSTVALFARPAGGGIPQTFAQPPCAGAVASEAQGEALAFTRDGRAYVTASEGANPALHRFAAP